MMTPGLCKLFIDSFARAPLLPKEPWEDDQRIRNAHFYAEGYLHCVEAMLSREFERRGFEFTPLPWYRRKKVCQLLVRHVRSRLRPAQTRDNRSLQRQARRLGLLLHRAVKPYAKMEYTEYVEKIRVITETQQ